MPVRAVCPSCATQLQVKDEFAGRALKCPKCGAIIPPPAADVPPPLAAPPEPPRPVPIRGRPTARPADADDEADDRPPPRRDRRDDRDDDRPRRPRPRHPVRDDGPPQKSNTLLILGILAVSLLTCCGGGVYGVYWAMNRVKQRAAEFVESLKPKNDRVTQANYDKLTPGTTTLAQVEEVLGPGRKAYAHDFTTAYPENGNNVPRDWEQKITQNRVMVWQNVDDYLFVAFYPKSDPSGRVQMKAFKPKTGAAVAALTPDDAKFAQDNKLPPPGADKESNSPPAEVTVTADVLIQAYRDNQDTANLKYEDKWVQVNNAVVERKDANVLVLTGVFKKKGGPPIRIQATWAADTRDQLADVKVGARVSVKGECTGLTAGTIYLNKAEIVP